MKKFISLSFFGIAMEFLEAAVVVYLREIIAQISELICYEIS